MPHPEQPVPVLSPAEYQAMTLHEVADELVVGAVAYSRSEWEPDLEDGVRHRTHHPHHRHRRRHGRSHDAGPLGQQRTPGLSRPTRHHANNTPDAPGG
ncbi:hypothetical protein O1L68_40520 [Streptomyces lydicus]|nr:hypothetical protein [Streptomyces lydicus]